jgi:anti-sigma regulatory factor (Ser/Thr protein kinase)
MTASPPRRVIRIPSETGHLAEVRAFDREAVVTFGAGAAVGDDLVQAVDEAVCNVIVHGYRGVAGEIEVSAETNDGRIEIRILDRSERFDPTAARAPDLTVPPLARKPGGMGIHLVRTATDEVHHRARSDGGNELLLVRRIDGSREED